MNTFYLTHSVTYNARLGIAYRNCKEASRGTDRVLQKFQTLIEWCKLEKRRGTVEIKCRGIRLKK